MIWSKYLSLMLIALTVLVLAGCEEKQESPFSGSYPRATTPTPAPTPTSAPSPTPTAKPIGTANPLISVFESYMESVEQFAIRQNQLLEEHDELSKSRKDIFPPGWKTEFSELLTSESKLLADWEMIEPPEVFLGFHETYQRGLTLFVERHNLLTSWLETFDGDTATQSAPWEQDTAIANDQQRVFTEASKGWEYGTTAYAAIARGREIPNWYLVPTPAVGTTRASQYSTQIAAISSMTNCLVLKTHFEYALDSRWKAGTDLAKRDADAYITAVSERLRALCD